MIEVRIRHEDHADSIHLMDWDPANLDQVIPLIKAWGLRFADEGYEYGRDGDLTGEFVVADGRAAFEVLVSNEDG